MADTKSFLDRVHKQIDRDVRSKVEAAVVAKVAKTMAKIVADLLKKSVLTPQEAKDAARQYKFELPVEKTPRGTPYTSAGCGSTDAGCGSVSPPKPAPRSQSAGCGSTSGGGCY